MIDRRPCPRPGSLRSAELALADHLANRLAAWWFAGTYSGIDRETGEPLVTVYAHGWPEAMTWAAQVGGEWCGYRLAVVEYPGER